MLIPDLSAEQWAIVIIIALVLCSPRTWRSGRQAMSALTGRPQIIDGDTIRLKGRRVRIAGINAPEMGQRVPGGLFGKNAGAMAARELHRIIGRSHVRLEPITTDCYGRTVARVYAGDVDVGAEMIKRGFALAYGGGDRRYRSLEKQARDHSAGLWARGFERPAEVRNRARQK